MSFLISFISFFHDDIFLFLTHFIENIFIPLLPSSYVVLRTRSEVLPLTTDYKQKAKPLSDTYNFLRQENPFPLPRIQFVLDLGPHHGKQLWDVTLRLTTVSCTDQKLWLCSFWILDALKLLNKSYIIFAQHFRARFNAYSNTETDFF